MAAVQSGGLSSVTVIEALEDLKIAEDSSPSEPKAVSDFLLEEPPIPMASPAESPVIVAKGIGAQILLLADRIRIKRRGLRAFALHGAKGEKDIFISEVSSIQFKKAGMLFNGYIQFAFRGGQEAKAGIRQAVEDENTVMFNSSQQPAMERFRRCLNERIVALRSSPTTTVVATPSTNSELDEIEKLARLRDKGIITDEEFRQKKHKLLGI